MTKSCRSTNLCEVSVASQVGLGVTLCDFAFMTSEPMTEDQLEQETLAWLVGLGDTAQFTPTPPHHA